jgi:fructose-1,6-bisphosphatase/inositol monophosphatase family enzyme
MASICARALFSACIRAGFVGGDVIRNIHASGDLNTELKKHKEDFVTVADVSSQIAITSTLHAIWPDLLIIGEEDTVDDPATVV